MKQDIKTLPKWAQRRFANIREWCVRVDTDIVQIIDEIRERRDKVEVAIDPSDREAIFLTELMQRLSKVGAKGDGETRPEPAGTSRVDG